MKTIITAKHRELHTKYYTFSDRPIVNYLANKTCISRNPAKQPGTTLVLASSSNL